MGILSRFAKIMEANINDLLDKCEDPAKMVDQTLRDLNENLAEVKKETAGVIAEETRCKRNVDSIKEDIQKWDNIARKALSSGNEGDARQALTNKQITEAKLADATKVYDLAKANADKMRQMHDKLVNDINILNGKRESIKAKAAVAKTQSRINKVTSNANVSGSLAAFENLEARVDKQLDTAMAEAELNNSSSAEDDLAAKYGNGTSSSSVDDELAKLKAEMGI